MSVYLKCFLNLKIEESGDKLAMVMGACSALALTHNSIWSQVSLGNLCWINFPCCVTSEGQGFHTRTLQVCRNSDTPPTTKSSSLSSKWCFCVYKRRKIFQMHSRYLTFSRKRWKWEHTFTFESNQIILETSSNPFSSTFAATSKCKYPNVQ